MLHVSTPHHSPKRPARLALALLLAGSLFGNSALAGTGENAAGTTQALPTTAPAEAPALTQHVIDLIKAHKLVELRTIYNGPFAAAMFFNPETLNYIVMLLKHHDFWWVGETADGHKAETLYTKLATQTIKLAAPDLAKIQLDARIAVAQRKLEARQKREAELAQQIAAQQKIVEAGTAAQSQLLSEAEALNAQHQQLEQQLTATQAAIKGLQSKAEEGPSFSNMAQNAQDVAPASASSPAPAGTSHKSRIQIRATAHP